jgi:hypothetical protein
MPGPVDAVPADRNQRCQFIPQHCGYRPFGKPECLVDTLGAGDPNDGGGDTRLPGTVAFVERGWPETGLVTARRTTSVFAGFRFPPEVISLAVRWYLRYGLSYRDVEELLAERGVTVDHVTIYRWVQRFTPEFIEAARPCRHAPVGCQKSARPVSCSDAPGYR